MYYYFGADFPAVLKINGIYYGSCYANAKFITTEDTPFVELCALNEQGKSLSFVLDSEFLLCPRESVSVTDLDGGYFIKFELNCHGGEFKVVEQKRFSDSLVTVFNDNGLKISVESNSGFFAENFAFFEKDVEITHFETLPLVAVYFSTNKTLNVYLTTDGVKKVFSGQVSAYNINGDTLYTEETFVDMKKHVVKRHLKFTDGHFQILERTVDYKGFAFDKVSKELLPYAFIEELLVGGDISEYLGQNMLENKSVLKEYLGDFLGVVPPPVFKEQDLVGLVYKDKKNRYKVKYLSCEIKDNLIENIKLI